MPSFKKLYLGERAMIMPLKILMVFMTKRHDYSLDLPI